MAETYAEEIQPVEPSLVRIPAICRRSHGESSFHHAMPSATDFLFLLIVPMLYHGVHIFVTVKRQKSCIFPIYDWFQPLYTLESSNCLWWMPSPSQSVTQGWRLLSQDPPTLPISDFSPLVIVSELFAPPTQLNNMVEISVHSHRIKPERHSEWTQSVEQSSDSTFINCSTI